VLGQSTAALDANQAALDAHVEVRLLEEVKDLAEVDRLFCGVWGGSPQEAVSIHMMRALAHTGNYVAGTFAADGCLVGASVGFLTEGAGSLHSHISGVDPRFQGRGIGYALKLHQRDWTRSRGIEHITWTFDPLIRRNAWFNLAKLGARAESYHVDFYGPMNDGINGGDPTDRLFVVWELDRAVEPVATERARPLLAVGPDGRPVVLDPDGGGPVTCQVPPDAVGLRGRDPGLAGDWRLALRATMGQVMAGGARVTAFTPDGRYVLA
jgi:predicted GNAT superfamily acetyltransferase